MKPLKMTDHTQYISNKKYAGDFEVWFDFKVCHIDGLAIIKITM